MKGKILFVVGLGVGYVLGARAGRERYEQIRRAALNVWNQPAVQQGVETVKDFAKTRVGDLSDTVLDGVKGLIGNATKGSGSTTSSPAKPSSSTSSATKASTSKASAAKPSTSKPSTAKPSTAKPSSSKPSSSTSSSSTSSSSKPASTSSSSSSGGGSSATSGS